MRWRPINSPADLMQAQLRLNLIA